MSFLTIVQSAITEVVKAEESVDGVYVTTQCMYPTGGYVRVAVRGGLDTFIISDEGYGFREIENTGTESKINEGSIKHLVVPQGLRLSGGVITSPSVRREALPVAITLVANASKEVADWFYTHLKIKRSRNFKQLVRRFLNETFAQNVKHDSQLIGKSNKTHKFENVILLPNGRRLIVDPVINEHASISSRIVANLDVGAMQYENLEQRIVYDDEDDEDWKVEDLNLLAMSAPAIPFSKSHVAIREMALHHG